MAMQLEARKSSSDSSLKRGASASLVELSLKQANNIQAQESSDYNPKEQKLAALKAFDSAIVIAQKEAGEDMGKLNQLIREIGSQSNFAELNKQGVFYNRR